MAETPGCEVRGAGCGLPGAGCEGAMLEVLSRPQRERREARPERPAEVANVVQALTLYPSSLGLYG